MIRLPETNSAGGEQDPVYELTAAGQGMLDGQGVGAHES